MKVYARLLRAMLTTWLELVISAITPMVDTRDEPLEQDSVDGYVRTSQWANMVSEACSVPGVTVVDTMRL